MPHNLLLTGPPRIGKTTAVERAHNRLEADGYLVGGVYAPEIRADGERRGFEIVDALTGDRAVMAHVDFDGGPTVGKYRIDVAAVDAVCEAAFDRALADADVAVIDEIAPMQVESEAFVRGVRAALDAELPVIAAIEEGSTSGPIGDAKARDHVELLTVTLENRDAIPARLVERVRNWA